MATTSIEWTDRVWNPMTGCTKISAGCDNCYAHNFAERFRGVPGHHLEQGFDLKLRPERLSHPLGWKPSKIFVNSMSDLFHIGVPDEFISRVFDTMEATDRHTYQVLTKRTARMRDFVNARYKNGVAPQHIWLGTSVENQAAAVRVKQLRAMQASVRFLSVEPLLGPVTLSLDGIHWVIVGGESGPRSRPMDVDWARSVRDQCVAAGVPFFFKQWGQFDMNGLRQRKKSVAGRLLDGRVWDEFPTP